MTQAGCRRCKQKEENPEASLADMAFASSSERTSSELQDLGDIPGEDLHQARQGMVSQELREGLDEHQGGAAQQGEVGDEDGFSRTGLIFPHLGITAPVVADFDPAPVATDEVVPSLGWTGCGGRTGNVVSGFPGFLAAFLVGPLDLEHEQGLGSDPANRGRQDGVGRDFAHANRAPGYFCRAGKKGEWTFSKPLA